MAKCAVHALHVTLGEQLYKCSFCMRPIKDIGGPINCMTGLTVFMHEVIESQIT